MPEQIAEYVVTREQVMALAASENGQGRDELLRAILGACESTWKGLRCRRYEGHQSYHSSGQVDGAWASWETHSDGEVSA